LTGYYDPLADDSESDDEEVDEPNILQKAQKKEA
jgi:hypothetical protein